MEFSTLGALLDANCSATGTDRLVGTLVGYEAGNPDSDNVYVGTLLRTTRISHCGSRRNPTTGEDAVCSMSITGDGIYEVMLSIEAGQREGYLQYISNRAQYASLLESLPRPVGQTGSSVTGTCEPPEMAQMQTDYDQGQTAGSPNGQPIEVPSLPPSSYPFTFAARPPTSNWTLKVLRRRP